MKKNYTAPEAGVVPVCFEDCLFTVTSGYDQFHQGGGGFYGDNDINDNPFIF
jgi:hypothetical protein